MILFLSLDLELTITSMVEKKLVERTYYEAI